MHRWNSASEIVAECPAEVASTSHIASTLVASASTQYTTIQLVEPSKTSKTPGANSITLGTHVSLDRLAILEKNLASWKGPVSLAVFVPVKKLSSGLDSWQR